MSKIEWTNKTQNPIKRKDGGNYCELISPGCQHCFASLLNSKGTRFGGNGLTFGGSNQERPEMALKIDMLESWARMTKPKKIFVGSMTDVFGEWVSDEMIFALLDAMAAAPTQTFQLLTKRPERMMEIIKTWQVQTPFFSTYMPDNIWLGISAEDQIRLDERLIWLIRTPATVRFLSLEPLLGPILLPDPDGIVNMTIQEGDNPIFTAEPIDYIDWVIIGGESGPNARPLKVEWIEDILSQCRDGSISAFVKQIGTPWAIHIDKTHLGTVHPKGGDPDEWPTHLRVRMMPGEVWK